MRIIPQGTKIVVDLLPSEEVSEGGIIIPESAQQKSTIGIVVAVGPGIRDTAAPKLFNAKVGDKVLFSKYGGNEAEIGRGSEKHTYTVLDADAVYGIVED